MEANRRPREGSRSGTREGSLDDELIGRLSEAARPRVIVQVEVVDYYCLRYFELPSKLELYEGGALTWEFLLGLAGLEQRWRELGL